MSSPFRGLDANGDWSFGYGKQSYFVRSQAIVADIGTSLKMFLNDCFFAMDTGIDWWNLLGAKNPTAQNEIIMQCRRMIAQVDGVVRINSVDAVFNSTSRSLSVTYNIDTVYSQNVLGNITL